MPNFTPAQQDFYNALIKADREHIEIAGKILNAYMGDNPNSAFPEKFGAPVGTPAWDLIEDAAQAFDKATGAIDNQTAARTAMPVVDAVLAAKR